MTIKERQLLLDVVFSGVLLITGFIGLAFGGPEIQTESFVCLCVSVLYNRISEIQ